MIDLEFEQRKERAQIRRSVLRVVEDIHAAAQLDDRYRDQTDSHAYAILGSMNPRPEPAPGEHQGQPHVDPAPVDLGADPGVQVDPQGRGIGIEVRGNGLRRPGVYAGIEVATVSMWRYNPDVPGPTLREALAKLFGVKPEDS